MDGAGEQPIYTASSPPRRCRNDHPLGAYKVVVSFAHCACSRVKPRSVGHLSWKCRTCGDVIVGDGHTDDGAMFSH